MKLTIDAACGCTTGKIRKNNEDNFCFNGICLDAENQGLEHPVRMRRALRGRVQMAVFDGMGGERFGELAACSAAQRMRSMKVSLSDRLMPAKTYLEKMTAQLNDAVVTMQKEKLTDRMGTTVVGACFGGRDVHVWNVGDSRAYRLRNGAFVQLSVDHIVKRPGRETKKAPLTQYLGIDPTEFRIIPYVVKCELKRDDVLLLCSDGLTDMLMDSEISDIVQRNADPEAGVEELIRAALEHGGRDNITVMLIMVK